MQKRKKYIIFFGLIGFAVTSFAQTDSLPEVKISAAKNAALTQSAVPYQQLTQKDLSRLNSLSVGEAAKYFSAVLIKDYGGIGGLKTISVRSLGANHTAVLYDGLFLANAQAGQLDLGNFSTGNLASISLLSAQPPSLLLPAKSFASANVLQLKSLKPVYDASKKYALSVSVLKGSYGFWQPSLQLVHFIKPNIYQQIQAEVRTAKGNYKFKNYETNSGYQNRKGGQMQARKLVYDLNFLFKDSAQLQFKAFGYQTTKGLPGAIIFYNTSDGEKLTEQQYFAQAVFKKNINAHTKLLLSGKYSYQLSHYTDTSFANSAGYTESIFHQREGYFSAAVFKELGRYMQVAYASDMYLETLSRTDKFVVDFAHPKRLNWLQNIVAKASLPKVTLQGNVLFTLQNNEVQTGEAAKNVRILSPSFSAAYQPNLNSPITWRAFYKNIFRAPSFNDLYYTIIGNTALKPEYASQYNVGFSYAKNEVGNLKSIWVNADVFYNRIKDKILALPRQNLFQWSMQNRGLVNIYGVETNAVLKYAAGNNWLLTARVAYSFQKALDKTNKQNPNYNQQIPYTPIHSGSAVFTASKNNWSVHYHSLFSGSRYRQGDAVPANFLPGWLVQDVGANYDCTIAKTQLKINFAIKNIFNHQYEIIKFYPMPGINYLAGITISI